MCPCVHHRYNHDTHDGNRTLILLFMQNCAHCNGSSLPTHTKVSTFFNIFCLQCALAIYYIFSTYSHTRFITLSINIIDFNSLFNHSTCWTRVVVTIAGYLKSFFSGTWSYLFLFTLSYFCWKARKILFYMFLYTSCVTFAYKNTFNLTKLYTTFQNTPSLLSILMSLYLYLEDFLGHAGAYRPNTFTLNL